MTFQHHALASGGWRKLSLIEQLGNIGSEVGRAIKWREKDTASYQRAVQRAFELVDLTLQDQRWRRRLKEIARLREVLGDALTGGQEYRSTFEDIERYLFRFALAARKSH